MHAPCVAVALAFLAGSAPAQTNAPEEPPSAAAASGDSTAEAAPRLRPEDIFNLDIGQLGQVQVRNDRAGPAASPSSAPGTTLDVANLLASTPTTTGELFQQAPSVAIRRTSTVNLDPRVRGYHSQQLNANAGGVQQLKTRIDIDSLFSQIDPSLVRQMTVVDGPYTPLYGPGFAFLTAQLFEAPRYARTEAHGRSFFGQDTNGGNLAWQQSVWGGGPDWGFYTCYVQRLGNDYRPGRASNDFDVPASYNTWNGFGAFSFDLTRRSRIEFTYLHSEQNNTELPGVVYDVVNSTTNQYDVRWVWRERPDEPERLVVQYWRTQTGYSGNSLQSSKQTTFYNRFVTDNFLPFAPPPFSIFAVTNIFAEGNMESDGLRYLATFGDPDLATATVGGDWRRYTLRHFEATLNLFGQSALVDAFPNPIFIPGVNTGPPDYRGVPTSTLDDFGFLAAGEVQWTERLRTSVGGRIDFTQASVDLSDPVAQEGRFPTVNIDPSPSEVLGMGYGTLEWEVAQGLTLTAGAGFAMRNPSLDEYYSNFPSTPAIRFTSPMLGRSDLKPEKNLQFDAGVRREWENLTIGVRAFQATIRDYILPIPLAYLGPSNSTFLLGRQVDLVSGPTPVPDSAIVLYQYNNIDWATLYGGDVSLEVRPTPWFIVDANLAYVKGTNHAPLAGALYTTLGGPTTIVPSGKGAEALPNIYPLASTVTLRFVEPEEQRYGLGIVLRSVMDQNYVADGIGEVRTPGYFTVGLQGHWNATNNIRLRTALTNVFDRTFTDHGSLALIDRSGNVSFVKNPGISWFTGLEVEY
jgi:outer membrane receptor protein involved in Fe transport